MSRVVSFYQNRKKAVYEVILSSLMVIFGCFPVFAADGTATLSDTLSTFTDVFAWFLEEGGLLLEWMLDKPIILLSLSVFFVGAVVGVLARIYSSF